MRRFSERQVLTRRCRKFKGVRGVTANPTIFAKAIEGSDAYDTQFALHQRIDQPNLCVKVPATVEGVPAIRAMIAEGRSINVTLIFSVELYREVIEAYLAGLETLVERGGDLGAVRSVASFLVSRLDSEVDARLEAVGAYEAGTLRGQAAVAQARLAYQLFTDHFAGPRWERLAAGR